MTLEDDIYLILSMQKVPTNAHYIEWFLKEKTSGKFDDRKDRRQFYASILTALETLLEDGLIEKSERDSIPCYAVISLDKILEAGLLLRKENG